MVKNLPDNSGDLKDKSLVPGLERPSGVGNGNLLQYSCQENSLNRGDWKATVHGVVKSRTHLHTSIHIIKIKIHCHCGKNECNKI